MSSKVFVRRGRNNLRDARKGSWQGPISNTQGIEDVDIERFKEDAGLPDNEIRPFKFSSVSLHKTKEENEASNTDSIKTDTKSILDDQTSDQPEDIKENDVKEALRTKEDDKKGALTAEDDAKEALSADDDALSTNKETLDADDEASEFDDIIANSAKQAVVTKKEATVTKKEVLDGIDLDEG